MSRIARNSVNGRLNRNTFCSGAEVVPVQCKRGLRESKSSLLFNAISSVFSKSMKNLTSYLGQYPMISFQV